MTKSIILLTLFLSLNTFSKVQVVKTFDGTLRECSSKSDYPLSYTGAYTLKVIDTNIHDQEISISFNTKELQCIKTNDSFKWKHVSNGVRLIPAIHLNEEDMYEQVLIKEEILSKEMIAYTTTFDIIKSVSVENDKFTITVNRDDLEVDKNGNHFFIMSKRELTQSYDLNGSISKKSGSWGSFKITIKEDSKKLKVSIK